MIGALALLAVIACRSGSPGDIADCGDADCRQEWILATWEGDRAAAVEAVRALKEPIERLTVVAELGERHPGETQALCAGLPPGPSHERCQRMNDRPHLWKESSPVAPADPRAAPGPATNQLTPAAGIISSFTDVPAMDSVCDGSADRRACIEERARAAARSGAGRRVARLCGEFEPGRWRWECTFTATEAGLVARGRGFYAQSTDLCLLTGDFRSRCLAHGLIRLARPVPPASDGEARHWVNLVASADAVRRSWEPRDPALGAVLVQRFWSEVTAAAWGTAPEVVGNALDVLPAEAVPHARAAAAARLLALSDPRSRDLAGWVTALGMALEARAETAQGGAATSPFAGAFDLWPVDRGDEGEIPAAVYRGTSRRALSEDRDTDLAICVLEAAARLRPPAMALLDEGEAHPEPRVRWTASRLKERLQARETRRRRGTR